ncbi:replication protein RepA [Bifidobacterium longum]|uniref:replication protein RepA n=1 Tax=Bifidobacterium longum TaxID=216816 RepID=UPI00130535E1|nr:replication protein RepA [Bifidobacterium longum]
MHDDQTNDPCFDPETNTLHLGTTFREFLRLIGVQVGGRQLKSIKPQLERLFKCVYIISNNTENTSQGVNFTVAEKYQIDWLRNEPQSHGLFENWVQLSQRYVDMLRDHPVPVDLKVIARLRKPMAIDVYWWLTKRVYNLHEPVTITWQQLYRQFGSDTKRAVEVQAEFQGCCGRGRGGVSVQDHVGAAAGDGVPEPDERAHGGAGQGRGAP